MANRKRVAGRLLTASAEDRVLNYLLVPYGEKGFPSSGPLTVTAGSIRIPEGDVIVNMEHDYKRPVGKTTRIEDTPNGIEVSVQIANTTVGDDLLEEVAFGLRTGISFELDECVQAGGILTDALLTGAGFVTTPAYNSARVMAELNQEERDKVAEAIALLEGLNTEETTDDTDAPAEESDTTESELNEMANASLPAELITASKNSNPDKSLDNVVRKIAGAHTGGPAQVTAALNDIVSTPIFNSTQQPQFLGELWNGRSFTQRFTGLVEHQPLTSRKAVGWRFTEEPTVGDWAGFPEEIHTSNIAVEPVEATAQRLASGNVLDRALYDFGETAFVDSYFRALTDDYARKIDSKVLTHISNSAVAITGGAPVAGISVAATKIVDGALHLLANDVLADYAVIGQDLYRELLLTPKDQVFEYLNAALGLEEGSLAGFRIIPTALPALQGKAIVGARNASTLFELPGASPVRVEALDVARGGVEVGLYGYFALIHSGRGIVKVN